MSTGLGASPAGAESSAVDRADVVRARAAELCVAILTLATAYALKSSYSTASADELRWILGPTVTLLETATGGGFFYEAGEGYLSRELNLLVAPSCAGVNFLIAGLCTGVFGLLGSLDSVPAKLVLPVAVAIGAYVLTIAANVLRLLVAIHFDGAALSGAGLGAVELHRAEGVIVYLTVLCGAFLLARHALAEPVR